MAWDFSRNTYRLRELQLSFRETLSMSAVHYFHPFVVPILLHFLIPSSSDGLLTSTATSLNPTLISLNDHLDQARLDMQVTGPISWGYAKPGAYWRFGRVQQITHSTCITVCEG